MKSDSPRNYNCKDEELPVMCGFVASSLERDLPDFSGYSPVFTDSFLNGFYAATQAAIELVEPKSETIEQKLLTTSLYRTLDELTSSINYLEGYISLAGSAIPISKADFGITELRNSSKSRDTERVLKLLRTVSLNNEKYKTVLIEKGLTESIVGAFQAAIVSLNEIKQKRYKLISNRKNIVLNNIGQLNDLYDQMSDICKIGKILYKQTNAAKLNDYTFSRLLKQVRKVQKKEDSKPDGPESEPTTT